MVLMKALVVFQMLFQLTAKLKAEKLRELKLSVQTLTLVEWILILGVWMPSRVVWLNMVSSLFVVLFIFCLFGCIYVLLTYLQPFLTPKSLIFGKKLVPLQYK